MIKELFSIQFLLSKSLSFSLTLLLGSQIFSVGTVTLSEALMEFLLGLNGVKGVSDGEILAVECNEKVLRVLHVFLYVQGELATA